MFKPSLKRSKNDQILVSLQKNIQNIKDTNTYNHQYTKQHKQYHQISIPQFFTKTINVDSGISQGETIIGQINCWNLGYPFEVKEKLNQPIQEVKSRIIGSKFGMYWLLTQNQLYLWRYDSLNNPNQLKIQRKYYLQKNVRAISIGHLDCNICSFMQKNSDSQVIAIGYENIIDLYKINITTLQLQKMQIKIKIGYGKIIQKLQITNNNQILCIGDEGYLSRISFQKYDLFGSSKIVINHSKPLKKYQILWELLSIQQKQNRVFSENIVATKNGKIYVLIRKQHQKSLISKLSQIALGFFSGRIREQQQKYQVYKQIHIYQVIQSNRSSKLKFEGSIKNYEISKKIKQSYYANQIISKIFQDNNQNYSCNNIVNIYLNKNSKQEDHQQVQKLSVVINYGLFITIRQNINSQISGNGYNFGFDQEPKILPEELFKRYKRENSMAFFMSGKNKDGPISQQGKQLHYSEFQPLLQPKSKIIYSLGMNNINLFENGLCVCIWDKSIQFVKLDRYPGFIIQSAIYNEQQKLDRNNIWCIFSKNQITVMKKLSMYENLLAVLTAMNQIRKEGVTNGENVEQYERYTCLMMEDIARIVGSREVCQGLCMLILMIIKNKIGELPLLNNKGQVILLINNELKQIVKEQIKIKMRLRNRFRSFQGGSSGQNYSLFYKWLVNKNKNIKLQQVIINKQIQQNIWKLFTLYSVERGNQYQRITYAYQNCITSANNYQNISVFSLFLQNHFRSNYFIIKNLGITQLRKSPNKIKYVKNNLLTILTFLQQKKKNSNNYIKKLMYYKSQINQHNKFKKDQSLSKTTYQITNDTSNTMTSTDKKDQLYMNQSLDMTSNDFINYQSIQNSKEQIQTQLSKLILKLITVIELYQLLAANSQRQYEYIPNIQNFFASFSAKQDVKFALLDLYISTELWKQATIIKYNALLPQLHLQADIYLSKWLKYIYQRRQYNIISSIQNRINISDIKELSEKLQLEQVLKIKCLFREICPLYIKILINQLEYRKGQENAKYKEMGRYSQKEGNQDSQSVIDKSIFAIDRIKSNADWKQWISTEISNIRLQIVSYLKNLAQEINGSKPEQYFKKQKLLDDSIKILQNSQQGINFIKQLISYLKNNNILQQKIYRFGLIIQPKSKGVGNLIMENVKPQAMSSFSLLNNSVKRNREEILSELNCSKIEDKSKNGESTATIL